MVERLKTEIERDARDIGLQMSFVREIGKPAQTLARFSRNVGADLIVVGKSSKILRHLSSSLVRRLVDRHDMPAIVVVP